MQCFSTGYTEYSVFPQGTLNVVFFHRVHRMQCFSAGYTEQQGVMMLGDKS